MQIPLEISFQHVRPEEEIKAYVHERVNSLGNFCDQMTNELSAGAALVGILFEQDAAAFGLDQDGERRVGVEAALLLLHPALHAVVGGRRQRNRDETNAKGKQQAPRGRSQPRPASR